METELVQKLNDAKQFGTGTETNNKMENGETLYYDLLQWLIYSDTIRTTIVT